MTEKIIYVDTLDKRTVQIKADPKKALYERRGWPPLTTCGIPGAKALGLAFMGLPLSSETDVLMNAWS